MIDALFVQIGGCAPRSNIFWLALDRCDLLMKIVPGTGHLEFGHCQKGITRDCSEVEEGSSGCSLSTITLTVGLVGSHG